MDNFRFERKYRFLFFFFLLHLTGARANHGIIRAQPTVATLAHDKDSLLEQVSLTFPTVVTLDFSVVFK